MIALLAFILVGHLVLLRLHAKRVALRDARILELEGQREADLDETAATYEAMRREIDAATSPTSTKASCRPIAALRSRRTSRRAATAGTPSAGSCGWTRCSRPRPTRGSDEQDGHRLDRRSRDAGVPYFHKQMVVDGRLCTELADFPPSLRSQEFPR